MHVMHQGSGSGGIMVSPGEIGCLAQPQVTSLCTDQKQKEVICYVLICTATATIPLFGTKRGHLRGSRATDEYLPI